MAQVCSFPLLLSIVEVNTPRNISLSHKTRPFTCLATQHSESTLNNIRQSANYKPASWTYDYVQSLKDYHIDEGLKLRAKKLEEEVKRMIVDEKTEILKKLEVIDDIQRMGLGYKYDDEIGRALSGCVSWVMSNTKGPNKSLHAIALCFRLLRQHGYEISHDVLKSFMDDIPSACLYNDVQGMLSLHEASHFAFEGESFFDDAKALITKHLEKHLKGDSISNSLYERVNHELELSLHHRMPRLEARWYIEAYSKRSDSNQVLLEDAKLDFNLVQSNLRRELKDVSRWWKEIGLATKLSFARDRLVECFFWVVGMVFEPQYSDLRKRLTKVLSLISAIDDIYDVYGTLDELEQFTTAVERWDIKCVNDLPDYMRICFLALYNTVNDLVYTTLKEHDQYNLPYLAKAWGDMCKAFLREKKWSQNKETPNFQEYLDNGWLSGSGVVILSHAYFLITKNITKQGLESLENGHSLIRGPSLILRLCNDLATSKAELERGDTSSAIWCIMHEKGVSEEFARREIRNLVEETWKKMNTDMASESFPLPFRDTAINLARTIQCIYQYGDAYGDPDTKFKNRVLSIIEDPIF